MRERQTEARGSAQYARAILNPTCSVPHWSGEATRVPVLAVAAQPRGKHHEWRIPHVWTPAAPFRSPRAKSRADLPTTRRAGEPTPCRPHCVSHRPGTAPALPRPLHVRRFNTERARPLTPTPPPETARNFSIGPECCSLSSLAWARDKAFLVQGTEKAMKAV